MSGDNVKILRDRAIGPGLQRDDELMDAADEIERLRQELEAATLEVTRLEKLVWSPMNAYPEIKQLREQLDAQATMIAECEDERMRLRHTVAIHKRRVREALGRGSDE